MLSNDRNIDNLRTRQEVMGIFKWLSNKKQKTDETIESQFESICIKVGYQEQLERVKILAACVKAVAEGFESDLFSPGDFQSVIEEVFELYFVEGVLPRPFSYTVFYQVVIVPLVNSEYNKQFTFYLLEKNRRDLAVSFEYDQMKDLNIPQKIRMIDVLRMDG